MTARVLNNIKEYIVRLAALVAEVFAAGADVMAILLGVVCNEVVVGAMVIVAAVPLAIAHI